MPVLVTKPLNWLLSVYYAKLKNQLTKLGVKEHRIDGIYAGVDPAFHMEEALRVNLVVMFGKYIMFL